MIYSLVISSLSLSQYMVLPSKYARVPMCAEMASWKP